MLPVVIEQARCLLAHRFIIHVEVADSKQPVQLHPLYQPLTAPVMEVKRLYTNVKRPLKAKNILIEIMTFLCTSISMPISGCHR